MISGLRYQAQFNSISTNNLYTLNIYKKNYSGSAQTILLGADPVVQEWNDDSYLGPIKGTSLKINIINNGDISLNDFYSNIDNEFYIEFINVNQILFRGYIVQDDCQEIQIDFSHIINITATDNLGLLKELKFDEAARLYGTYVIDGDLVIQKERNTNNVFYVEGRQYNFYNGQLVDIDNVTSGRATYTVDYTEYIDGKTYVHTYEEVLPITIPIYGGAIYYYQSFDLQENTFINYAKIFRMCLHATNMRLDNYVCTTLFPIGGQIGRWLEDTCVNINTFLSSNEWDSCYEILEKIFKRFDATIFQSLGSWYIVRWNEIKVNGNWGTGSQVPTYLYDGNFFVYQNTTNNGIVNEYNVNQIETGLLKSIIRPYKFIEEDFNFNGIESPNLNLDLQILGDLMDEYTLDGKYYKEYEFANWELTSYGQTYNVTKRIVIVYEYNNGPEIERYLKLKGNEAVTYAIVSKGIQVDKYTQIDLSFDVRTTNNQTGALNFAYWFGIGPYDRSYLYKLNINSSHLDGTWTTNGSYDLSFSDNSIGWHSVQTSYSLLNNTISKLIQTDREGYFFISLNTNVFSNSSEATYYKNLQIKLTPLISNNELITGQKHTEIINNSLVKNNYTEEVFIDDTTNRTMKGCQFLYENTTSLLTKTTKWNIQTRSYEYDSSLGEYMTKERLVNQFNANTRYEGTLRGIMQNGPLSMFALLKMPFESEYYRYAFGQLSINYREESADFTAYRVFDANSYDDLLSEANYKFDYLYQNK